MTRVPPLREPGSVIALLVAFLLVAAPAQASSQFWALQDTATAGEGDGTMIKSGTASGSVTIGQGATATTHVWVADQAATTAVDFGTGEWSLTITTCSESASTDSTWTVGSWNALLDSFTAEGSAETPLDTNGDGNCSGTTKFQPDNPFVVPDGEFLAMRITVPGVALGPTDTQMTFASSDGLSSPPGDPGYPTPLLASLILLTAGILLVAGVVYARRRRSP